MWILCKCIPRNNNNKNNGKNKQKRGPASRKGPLKSIVDFAQSKQIKNLSSQIKQVRSKIPVAIQNRVKDGVHHAIQARLDPFNAIRGMAANLNNAKPSQKFMAKGTTTVSVPAGCSMAFMSAPCVVSDALYKSVVIAVQTAPGVPLSGNWKSGVVGVDNVNGGTLSYITTATPYTAATLATGFEWSSVGTGLRFTYEGPELYRSGVLRYMVDIDARYNQGNANWTTVTIPALTTLLDSSVNTIRHSINNANIVEINCATNLNTELYSEADIYWGGSNGSPIGGGGSTSQFSNYPSTLGYYTNSSGFAVSFHIECIEHWSLTGPSIQSLLTPNFADTQMDAHLNAVLDTTRQLQATTPNVPHTTVLQKVVKAANSPIGHAVLNAAIKFALA